MPFPRALLHLRYEEAAQQYLRSLPPEHFMEATSQATQRKITLESLDLVHARRPDVQVFNELLVQYPLDDVRIGQVVPDNMVVVHDEPIRAESSFNVPLQPVGPLLVMEYVSKNNRRKDYEASFDKYEGPLKVPYYLLFVPDAQELTLYRRKRGKYVSSRPNEHGRYAVSEIELEVRLLDGWVRYWFRGQLLPLPADLQRDLDEALRRADELARRLEQQEAEHHRLEAELARLRALLGQQPPPGERR